MECYQARRPRQHRERADQRPDDRELHVQQQPEWQASGTNHFGVILKLGKFYDLDTGAGVQPCNITLLAVVTPLNNGATTAYAVPQSDFAVIQNRNSGINSVATALASAPVSEVAF